MHLYRPSKNKRAQGMPDAFTHPQPCVQVKKARKQVTTGTPKQPALPAQWFTAYLVLSPVSGLDSHRRERIISTHLTSASGSQDHTPSLVRVNLARPARPTRPSHPAANVRDDRDTPLLRRRDLRRRSCFSEKRKENVFESEA
jgi:hypothetical protein